MHQYGQDVTSAQKSCICGTTFVCNKGGVISHEVQQYQPVKLQSQCISPSGQVKACSLWNATQGAHFDLRGLSLQCFFSPAGPVTLKQHKEAKKARVQPKNMGVKHGVLTPLVFSTSGSMGREASTFYKRLADMLSNKQGKPYSVMMGWSPVFCHHVFC